jgi:hypothetical protein
MAAPLRAAAFPKMTKPSTIISCLLPLIISAAVALGAWEAVKGPTNGLIRDLDFVNANSGWAAADEAILRYQNGTWTVNKKFETPYFVGAIDAYDDKCAWAAVKARYTPTTMYYWDGSSWTAKDVIDDGFAALAICAKDEGWGCSSTKVYHWDGSSWRVEGPSTSPWGFYDIEFYDGNYGFLSGDYGRTWKYVNGTWYPVPVPASENLERVVVIAPEEVWAAGWRSLGMDRMGVIGHYRRGNWAIYDFPGIFHFGGIGMADNLFGWASGIHKEKGNVMLKWDGVKWAYVRMPIPAQVFEIATLSREDAWACGSGGWFLRYRTGPGVTPSSLGRIKAIFK